jgi:hypothetical protein
MMAFRYDRVRTESLSISSWIPKARESALLCLPSVSERGLTEVCVTNDGDIRSATYPQENLNSSRMLTSRRS